MPPLALAGAGMVAVLAAAVFDRGVASAGVGFVLTFDGILAGGVFFAKVPGAFVLDWTLPAVAGGVFGEKKWPLVNHSVVASKPVPTSRRSANSFFLMISS